MQRARKQAPCWEWPDTACPSTNYFFAAQPHLLS